MLPQDQFGAATAYVDDEARVVVVFQRVRYTEIDQPRFLPAADDFHLVAQDFLRASDELQAVACLAQGVGSDHAHVARGQQPEALAQPLKAFQRPGDGLGIEHVGGAETLGQTNHFTVLVDHLEAVAPIKGDDEVKAVGT